MWYASLMPETLPKDKLQAAKAAIENARKVREFHARRTPKDSPQRAADIELALTRLKEAMKPLRAEIGRFPYGAQTDKAEANREVIRQASEAIQAQRRRLWKLKQRRRTT